MNRLFSVLGVLLALAASPAAAQVTRVVDGDGQATAANCDASSPAFTSVTAAIAASSQGDAVLVCPGKYIENVDFGGKAIAVRSVGGAAVTVLDGNGVARVVIISAIQAAGAVLEGFTIQNGKGGILIENASPVIRRNVIVNNESSSGGGIYVYFSSPLIEENTIAGNGYPYSGWGGGIYVGGASTAVIRRNRIVDNVIGSGGGGIDLNSATDVVLDSNVIAGNTAQIGGGIEMMNSVNATIVGNLIVRNRASQQGGGINWMVPSGTRGPLLVNNTIAENDGLWGSGIFADGYDRETVLINNVIAAIGDQAAVFCGDFNDLYAPNFLFNNVTSPSGVSYGGICADQTGQNGNISAAPAFVDVARSDFHLLPGSPGVDAGDNSAPGLTSTDIDGHQRVLDGDGDLVATVDMGADELSAYSGQGTPGPFERTSPADGSQEQPIAITLTWGASAGATGYEYCYDTVNNATCDGTWLPAWGNTFATVFGLEDLTTYYWHVRARNAGGLTYATGNPSVLWSFTTRLTEPKPFSKISPMDGAGSQQTTLTLSWQASPGATGYEYCYDTVNNGTCDGNWLAAGTSTSATVTGLHGYTMYFWQVRAINAAGATYANGSTASFWRFTTGMAMPGAFGKTAPTNGAKAVSTPLTLTWQASPGAANYQYCIDRVDNGVCDSIWVNVGNATSSVPTSLPGGTIFYWQVRAVNAGGTTDADGGSSAFWSFATELTAPGSFTKASPGNGAMSLPTTVSLTWQTSVGASDYEYCYDTVNNGACDTGWVSTSGTLQGSATGLTLGTTYYWQVRARNAAGTTEATGGWWSFITVLPSTATIDAVTADRTFPAPAGVPVTWTVTAHGGSAPIGYKFWLFDQAAAAWTVLRDWNTSSQLTWTPEKAGTYSLQVWVRSAGSTAKWEDWKAYGPFDVTVTPLAVTSFTTATVFPVKPGTSITWTAAATGGMTPLQYKFWLYQASTATWTVLQDYSPAREVVWIPQTSGAYRLQVWVRSAGSAASYEAWLNADKEALIEDAKPRVTALTSQPASPVNPGTPVTWTASATGGTPPLLYRFYLYNEQTASWTLLQDYSSSNQVTWTPQAMGTYWTQVWVRSAGSTATWEDWKASDVFSVTSGLTVETFTSNVSPPVTAGTPVTLTATTAGGVPPVEYKFWVRDPAGAWTMLRDYGTGSEVIWTPAAAGTYFFQVWVRNAGSTAKWEAWKALGPFDVVAASPTIAALTASPLPSWPAYR